MNRRGGGNLDETEHVIWPLIDYIAPLIVAFSLLISAATASAECAWVLWESYENSMWKIQRALPDHKTCIATLDDKVRTVKRMGASVFRDGPDTAVYSMKISGKISGNMRLNCFPDTVDPRGPKGK